MSLNVQLKTILFSFLLGILSYYLRKIFYKNIYNKNIFIRILSSFLYIESITIIYLKCSYIINNLNIHFYSIFFLIIGYFFAFFHCTTKKIML